MTTHGRDLLVAAPERWDEACFSAPAVRALMASGMSVGILCLESQQAFWQTLPNLFVLAYAPKTKPKSVALAIDQDWQAAIVWEPGIAADALQLAGVPRRMGPNLRSLKKRLTQALGVLEKPMEHRVRYYLAFVEEMGIKTDQPDFFAPMSNDSPPPAGSVLLCPDSDFGPSHEWPVERWLEIAKLLLDAGHSLTVAGLLGARGCSLALAKALAPDVPFCQASPLAEALPMLARHAMVIAADGSLPHLAAHAGATCVTLFGPNDPAWKRPLGRRHVIVRQHVECAPCLLVKCPLDARCQRELTTARLWASLPT